MCHRPGWEDKRFETWICDCWKEVIQNNNTKLKGFVSYYDSSHYTNMITGKKGDHIFVLRELNPDAVDDEDGEDIGEGFISLENRAYKYAVMNEDGEMICDFIYDYVSDFEEGYAQVTLNGKEGYIDKDGKFYDEKPKE